MFRQKAERAERSGVEKKRKESLGLFRRLVRRLKGERGEVRDGGGGDTGVFGTIQLTTATTPDRRRSLPLGFQDFKNLDLRRRSAGLFEVFQTQPTTTNHHQAFGDGQFLTDDGYKSTSVPEDFQQPLLRVQSVVSSRSFGSDENWVVVGSGSSFRSSFLDLPSPVPSLQPLPSIESGGLDWESVFGGSPTTWNLGARDEPRSVWGTTMASTSTSNSLAGYGEKITTPTRPPARSALATGTMENFVLYNNKMDADDTLSRGSVAGDADTEPSTPTMLDEEAEFRLSRSRHGVNVTKVFRYVFQDDTPHPESFRRRLGDSNIGPPPSVLPPDPPRRGRPGIVSYRTPDRNISPTASTYSTVNTDILFQGASPPPRMGPFTRRPSEFPPRTPSSEKTFNLGKPTSRVDNVIQANGFGSPADLRIPIPFRTNPINDFYAVKPGPGVEISPGGNSVKVTIERDPTHPRNTSLAQKACAERYATKTRPAPFRDTPQTYLRSPLNTSRAARGSAPFRRKSPKKRVVPDMAELRRKYILRKSKEASLKSPLVESSKSDAVQEEEKTELKSPLAESSISYAVQDEENTELESPLAGFSESYAVQEEEQTEPKSPLTDLIESYFSDNGTEEADPQSRIIPAESFSLEDKEDAELNFPLAQPVELLSKEEINLESSAEPVELLWLKEKEKTGLESSPADFVEASSNQGREVFDRKASVDDIYEMYSSMEEEETDLITTLDVPIETSFIEEKENKNSNSTPDVFIETPSVKGEEEYTTTPNMSTKPSSIEGKEKACLESTPDLLIEALSVEENEDVTLKFAPDMSSATPSDKEKEEGSPKSAPDMSIEASSIEGNEEIRLEPVSAKLIEASSDEPKEETKPATISTVAAMTSLVPEKEKIDPEPNQAASIEIHSPKGNNPEKNPDLKPIAAATVEKGSSVQEENETDLQLPSVNSVEQHPIPTKEEMFKSTLAELINVSSLKGKGNANPDPTFSAGEPASSTRKERKVESQKSKAVTPVVKKTETPRAFKSLPSKIPQSSLGRAYNTAPGAATPSGDQLAFMKSALRPVPKPQVKPTDQLQKGNAMMAEWQKKKKRVSEGDAYSSKKQ